MICPALPKHAEQIVAAMREHEKMEFAVIQEDPIKLIKDSLERSDVAWSAFVDGQIVCMWGIKRESLITGGHIWLVTTPLVEKHARRFLRENRRVVREAVKTYYLLYGYVDAAYLKSCKWMEWLGFKPTTEANIGSLHLIRYEMRAV